MNISTFACNIFIQGLYFYDDILIKFNWKSIRLPLRYLSGKPQGIGNQFLKVLEINSKVPIIMKCSRNLVSNSQFHRYEPKKVVGLLFGTQQTK
ncbi:hypothetical protein pb186bvf_014466 [Paramecium bursaria]